MKILARVAAYGFQRSAIYVLIKLLQYARIFIYRYALSDNVPCLKAVRMSQPVQFVGRGKIILDGVTIGIWPSPFFLSGYSYFEARSKSAKIKVGAGTCFNNNAVLIADRGQISIGENCLIGPRFYVSDSDFHGLKVGDRSNGNYPCLDVVIGDNVFIGSDVKIMKGVTVGDGSVIGSGSIVLSDVPPGAIYGGVPAKLIRYL